jgi:hypothetical protein
MKICSRFAVILCVTIWLLIMNPIIIVKSVDSEWSPEIKVGKYYWKAIKAELRDLHTEERYGDIKEQWSLIGGINIPNGGIEVDLRSKPPMNFNFINGSRLREGKNVYFTVEGDMGPHLTDNGSDFHLLFLPIKFDNISFFMSLFDEIQLLESLTHSSYINSTITNTRAIACFKYNQTLDVKYEWDVDTGILTRKEVTAPSGKQLIVIPGKGSPYAQDITIEIQALIFVTLYLTWFGLMLWLFISWLSKKAESNYAKKDK